MATPSPVNSEQANEQDLVNLRHLVPLYTLSDESFQELTTELVVEDLKKGSLLFKQGDTDHVSIYLLSGEVSLLSGDRVVDKVSAGSQTARFPVAAVLPRKNTARAATPIRVARLDSRKVSDLLSRSHTVDYQVSDLDDSDGSDWMTLLLQSRVLQQVPAANIQRVMMSVDQVETHLGEDVIRQGDPGDYYFMLTVGSAVVKRIENEGEAAVELARLGPGDAFGEEALLSDNLRNSTVTMASAGKLLRLAKDDFLGLIQSSISHNIDIDEATELVEQGAVWLDLRSQEAYEKNHIPSSINLPIESLRYQSMNLASDCHYILYSNTGGRAMAGSFLLAERGFEVSILEGGLRALDNGIDAVSTPAKEVEDDDVLQRRVEVAEQRAKDLETRLKQAEDLTQTIENEKQKNLTAVKDAVDKAQQKLLHSEQDRQQALEEKEKAYNEMADLTSNLEVIESERAELADRMASVEGLDGKLQKRLIKAERELIGERESAESAASSLQEISQRLNTVMRDRETEREGFARDSGELKEQMTVLQLELEEARSDLLEVQSRHKKALGSEEQEALIDSLQQEAIDNSELIAKQDLQLSELRENALQLETNNQRQEITTESKELEQVKSELVSQQQQLDRADAKRRYDIMGMKAAKDKLQAANAKQLLKIKSLSETLSLNDKAMNEVAELKSKVVQGDSKLEQTQVIMSELKSGSEKLQLELKQRQNEVVKLRTVMKNYAEQISEAQDIKQSHETTQAEVNRVRARLMEVEQALSTEQEKEDKDVVSEEVLRQEVEALTGSLEERHKELVNADGERRLIEDKLEDVNTELESLKREMDQIAVDADESRFLLDEANSAKDQVQNVLLTYQQEAEEAKVMDLRDDRMKVSKIPLDIRAVAGRNLVFKLVLVLTGAIVAIAGMEVLSYMFGSGELFSSILVTW